MINNKPVIGLMPTSKYKLTDDPVEDGYWFRNIYTNCISEIGGVPLLIPLTDEKVIPEALEMCDGLLLPGGGFVRPVNFEIVDYFYKAKKPMLGICLGMQTLAMYSMKLDGSDKIIMKDVDTGVDHWPKGITREERDFLCHYITIDESSKLFHMMNDEVHPMVNSFHHRTISEVGSIFNIVAKSDDGLIEGIEYKGDDRFIVGVQYHPEHVKLFPRIFEEFIKACRK